MADEGDDEITTCQVCFRSHTETGQRVPRALPCFHTLCESCVGELIETGDDGDIIQCPECSSLYPTPEGVKSFRQNKYVLTYIRKMAQLSRDEPKEEPEKTVDEKGDGKEKPEAKEEDVAQLEICKDHGKKMTLFCQQFHCKRSICEDCLDNHQKYPLISIGREKTRAEREQKAKHETLLRNVDAAVADLERAKANLTKAQKKAKKSGSDALMRIRLRKEQVFREVNKAFEKISQEAKQKMKKVLEQVNESMETMDDKLTRLEDLKAKVNENKKNTVEDAERFNSILQENADQEEIQSLNRLEYYIENLTLSESHLEEFRGRLETDDLPVDNEHLFWRLRNRNAATCEYREIRTLRTWCLTQCVIPGHNGATVFCSAYRGGTRILKQFDLETGEEVQSVANLPHEMTGLAALDLGGTSCVAESNGDEIQFRLQTDLTHIVTTWEPLQGPFKFWIPDEGEKHVDVVLQNPHVLCSASPGVLLFEDRSGTPSVIRQLDVSSSTPRPLTPICHDDDETIRWQVGPYSGIFSTAQLMCQTAHILHRKCKQEVQDMCYIDDGGQEIVVVACGEGGLETFDLANGDRTWEAKGRLPGMEHALNAWGVTSNGRGEIFVADWDNSCIQMFSVDGAYLGPLLERRGNDTRRCSRILWNEATSSLLAAFQPEEGAIFDLRMLKVDGSAQPDQLSAI